MEVLCDIPTGGDYPRVFKVSAHTTPLALASAIAKALREQDYIELEAIGAGAIYRATMALTIARVLLAEDGLDLDFTPRFNEFVVDGELMVGLLFEVAYRPRVD